MQLLYTPEFLEFLEEAINILTTNYIDLLCKSFVDFMKERVAFQ